MLPRAGRIAQGFSPVTALRSGFLYSDQMFVPNPRIASTNKLRLGKESDRADREFWAAMRPEDRVVECWRLSLELWELKESHSR